MAMAKCLLGKHQQQSNDFSEDDMEYEVGEHSRHAFQETETFEFSNTSSCWVCNGYYGPNFNEPMCGTCHSFLHPNDTNQHLTAAGPAPGFTEEDGDSGNDEPPFSFMPPGGSDVNTDDNNEAAGINDNAIVDDVGESDEESESDNADEVEEDESSSVSDEGEGDEIRREIRQNRERRFRHRRRELRNNPPIFRQPESSDDEDNGELPNHYLRIQRPKPTPPPDLPQYMQLLSAPILPPADSNAAQITNLPVEVLIYIFSYLDDISLWNVSEVSKHWKEILAMNSSDLMWKKYLKKRWPLYRNAVEVPNWFSMYSALMSASFCRTCLLQMALKAPREIVENNVIRNSRLRFELLNANNSEGVEAIPFDNLNNHWQGSILGPTGSPYEKGKFYIYIYVPDSYPYFPPTVRFLTKILHPNISRHGDVGIDIIQHNWSLAITVSKLLLSVQSLLTDPCTEICMEPEIGQMYDKDRQRFEKLARSWTSKYAMFELVPPI